jgi:hypothetical protein
MRVKRFELPGQPQAPAEPDLLAVAEPRAQTQEARSIRPVPDPPAGRWTHPVRTSHKPIRDVSFIA